MATAGMCVSHSVSMHFIYHMFLFIISQIGGC